MKKKKNSSQNELFQNESTDEESNSEKTLVFNPMETEDGLLKNLVDYTFYRIFFSTHPMSSVIEPYLI